MWGSGFDAGGDQDAAQTLTGMGGAHTNSFPSFVPAAQPAADTAAGSAAGPGEAPGGREKKVKHKKNFGARTNVFSISNGEVLKQFPLIDETISYK